jgi:hypothetical protein
LASCSVILKAVTDFRIKYIARDIGKITLLPAEMAYLKEILKSKSKKVGEVLYIASRDGETGVDFHRECDNQGPTVVIVEATTGAIFGGYTDATWSNSNKYVPSTESFLFRLRPSSKLYPLKAGQEKYAIHDEKNHGPVPYLVTRAATKLIFILVPLL